MLFILTPYYLQAIGKKPSREEKMNKRLSTHFCLQNATGDIIIYFSKKNFTVSVLKHQY